jgi:hypothetical protein
VAELGKDPSYPWYPRDHAFDELVQTLSLAEEGAHRRLLDHQWMHGSIPDDLPSLARILKNIPPREMASIWKAIAPLYHPHPTDPKRLINRRLERIREERREYREKQRTAGSLGGRRTAEKRRTGGDPTSDPTSGATDSLPAESQPEGSSAFALASASALNNPSVGSSNQPASRPADAPEEDREADPPDATDGQVMARIRKVLYAPDGQPPEGWQEGREMSLIRALRAKGTTGDQMLRVVDGLRLLIDSGDVEWAPRGSKATLRAVYHTRNGVLDMWNQALDAYYRAATPETKRRGFLEAAREERRRRQPTPIGAIPIPLPPPEAPHA